MNEPVGETSPFALSRIYGQGWNAAKKLIAAGEGEDAATHVAARNPYRTGEESARWSEGYMAALDSRAASSPVRSRRR